MTEISPLVLALLAAAGGAALSYTLLNFRHRANLTSMGRQHEAEIAAARQAATAAADQARKDLQSQHERQLLEEQIRHKEALEAARADERQHTQLALKDAEERYERKLKEQNESALSVTVHPFVNTEVDKGILSKQHKVEIGYKYQLFVQGLPCFEPHAVVVERSVHKEVNEQTIEFLKTKALEAAEAAVQVKSGGGVASKVISVAKTAIKYAR